MSIFGAVGWLLGIPPAKDREARKKWNREYETVKRKKEINMKNILKLIFMIQMIYIIKVWQAQQSLVY
ncbi:hypothetical protein SLITO_v1c04540 [Spiroplasma litorale]|uniref:Uncharacterized protein n=1 Tax=Spiroplasma litorale TaxID=216942 RepID=A0A0K1W1X6_9MOLU|nr:hypothetical protein [Spiroplasma litorale]AKX34107.1 hypothetical protein SLITO_v1c04540 [Spiroplasma litorale]